MLVIMGSSLQLAANKVSTASVDPLWGCQVQHALMLRFHFEERLSEAFFDKQAKCFQDDQINKILHHRKDV